MPGSIQLVRVRRRKDRNSGATTHEITATLRNTGSERCASIRLTIASYAANGDTLTKSDMRFPDLDPGEQGTQTLSEYAADKMASRVRFLALQWQEPGGQ